MAQEDIERLRLNLDEFCNFFDESIPQPSLYYTISLYIEINQDKLSKFIKYLRFFLIPIICIFIYLKYSLLSVCVNYIEYLYQFIPVAILTIPLLFIILSGSKLSSFYLSFVDPKTELPVFDKNAKLAPISYLFDTKCFIEKNIIFLFLTILFLFFYSTYANNNLFTYIIIPIYAVYIVFAICWCLKYNKLVNFSKNTSNKIFVATRLLHPKYSGYIYNIDSNENNKMLDWLNSDDMQGLKINILRAVFLMNLKEKEYLTKIKLGFHFHRPQIVMYALLLFVTVWIACFSQYKVEGATRVFLRALGVTWWVWAIFLYQSQIKNLELFLEKTRNHFRSSNLPLFIWEQKMQKWRELPKDELHASYIGGNYGIDAEKIISTTQTILLTIYLISLGLL